MQRDRVHTDAGDSEWHGKQNNGGNELEERKRREILERILQKSNNNKHIYSLAGRTLVGCRYIAWDDLEDVGI